MSMRLVLAFAIAASILVLGTVATNYPGIFMKAGGWGSVGSGEPKPK